MRGSYIQPLGRKKKRLGDILLEACVISKEDLDMALVTQKANPSLKIGTVLVNMGVINEDDIAFALHKQLHLEYVHLSEMKIPDDIIHLVDEPIVRKHLCIPFAFKKDQPNILRVAMADPLSLVAIDDIAMVTGYQIETVVTTMREITQNIDRYYGNMEAMKVAEEYTKERQELSAVREKEEQSNDEDVKQAPIVKLVNQIIEQAVRRRASDIHIEPMENELRIRYRVDGVLQEAMKHKPDVMSAIVARIKIMGGMDISEKRKPQDGRITSIVDHQEYDIRVSILPTVYGEKIVMRITSKRGLTKDKKNLGFSDVELKQFDSILQRPHGIILVTGPTGSGKSTTLYTALSELNREGVNIITVEDPVEANIDGINQVQVNVKADLTFASALRSILRQDPDIIMIGEIRDSETAEIAVKASITGHLVVSTLHTNSAASTVTRLIDMGIEPYLIADSVVGIIAQRLVRRLCPKCRKAKAANNHEKDMLGIDRFQDIEIYEASNNGIDGKECPMCNNTGYYGRIGVYEIMAITPKLQEAISKKVAAKELDEMAIEEGMLTLRTGATRLVKEGITTIDEMVRIAFDN